MFQITNDKIYIGIIVLLVLGALAFLSTTYIKNCVRDELDEIKEEHNKKKKMMIKKQMRQRMIMAQQARQAELQAQQQAALMQSQKENNESEMPQSDGESYMDPLADS